MRNALDAIQEQTRARGGMDRTLAYIEENYASPLNVRELAHVAHFSQYHFIRVFRKTFHETPHQYLVRRRLDQAKELLACSERSVTEICFEVGFESPSSFSTLFRKVVGWSPSVYRARVWEMRRNPRKFIPNCYIVMHHIQVPDPVE